MSKNTESLIERIKQREERGLSKYGTTLDRTDMEPAEWIQHAQDEALDLAAYLEGLKEHRFPRVYRDGDQHGDKDLLERCVKYFERFTDIDERDCERTDAGATRWRLYRDIKTRLEETP